MNIAGQNSAQASAPPRDPIVLYLDLDGADYYDRVYGCWQGKNAGGTLGTPLEKVYGEAEPFDVWWYPELHEGGLPNDDLEMQLAWLKAIEEVGPEITARDMARYWLDHIGYNFDEYGLSKANLALGLEPPISGRHDNWFVDCMGSPIRSEIWACVTPGAPRIAARLAVQDAICDHAGGEGVNGEVFNAVLESAGFVIQDRRELIDIALGYIPESSVSALAVRTALAAYEEGLDWKQARQRVLEVIPHYVAQYSPINLGFQIIGLLWTEDFGEGICITVNCGYDTDSSGAAIGSYLGVLLGSSGLPAKWVEPLGNTISTNESWGGVKNLSVAQRPVPETLEELADRIREVARRVLHHHGLLDHDGKLRTTAEDLRADAGFAAELASSHLLLRFPGRDLDVEVDDHGSPVLHPDRARRVTTHLHNPREEQLEVTATLAVPAGWPAPATQQVTLAPGGSVALDWELAAIPRALISPSNALRLDLEIAGRPRPLPIPFVLVGARALKVLTLEHPGGTDLEALHAATLPSELPEAEDALWRTHSVDGADARLEDLVEGPSVVHVLAQWHSPAEQEVRLGADTTTLSRVAVNGEVVNVVESVTPFRPNLSGSEGSTAVVTLQAGWNTFQVTVIRGEEPVECHLLLCTEDRFHASVPGVDRTGFAADELPA